MKPPVDGPAFGGEAEAAWRRSVYTKGCARHFRKTQLLPAFDRLLRTAEASSDPAVRGAVTEYQNWERFVAFFESSAVKDEEENE